MGMGSSAETADARVDDATLAQARVAGLDFKFSQILAKFYQIMSESQTEFSEFSEIRPIRWAPNFFSF
jgi:hypothetical protein